MLWANYSVVAFKVVPKHILVCFRNLRKKLGIVTIISFMRQLVRRPKIVANKEFVFHVSAF